MHGQLFSCVWLCDPTDCSPSGSSVHGIFQARILEWVELSLCTHLLELFLICNIWIPMPIFWLVTKTEWPKKKNLHKIYSTELGTSGTSLMVRRLRVHLSVRGTWSLVWELGSHRLQGNQAHMLQLQKSEHCSEEPTQPKSKKVGSILLPYFPYTSFWSP